MAQYLKRWESPRREGRNRKGKGGSARKRQKVKQLKRLKQTLQQQQKPKKLNQDERGAMLPFFIGRYKPFPIPGPQQTPT